MGSPRVAEDVIAGRAVTLVWDDAAPEVPLLHLYPVHDVLWMIVAEDPALVEEAVKVFGAQAQ